MPEDPLPAFCSILELQGQRIGTPSRVDFPTETLMTLEFGLGMDRAIFDWISQSLHGQRPAKPGALAVLDTSLREIYRDAWDWGWIQQIVFPQLDVDAPARRARGAQFRLAHGFHSDSVASKGFASVRANVILRRESSKSSKCVQSWELMNIIISEAWPTVDPSSVFEPSRPLFVYTICFTPSAGSNPLDSETPARNQSDDFRGIAHRLHCN